MSHKVAYSSTHLIVIRTLILTGLLYTYLALGSGKTETDLQGPHHGAFRALERGYTHWASGRLDRMEVNYRHPEYCHVRCNMTPSMKTGLYQVYILLGKEGDFGNIKKATCECAAGYGLLFIIITNHSYAYSCTIVFTCSP